LAGVVGWHHQPKRGGGLWGRRGHDIKGMVCNCACREDFDFGVTALVFDGYCDLVVTLNTALEIHR
jgi:hypothetical protein